MTEQEWIFSDNPTAMLRFLTNRPQQSVTGRDRNPRHPGDRKLRLFACAVARQVWSDLTDERSRRAVEVAERFADAQADAVALHVAHGDARAAWAPTDNSAGLAYYASAANVLNGVKRIVGRDLDTFPSKSTLADLMREIVGNPIRPVGLPLERMHVPMGPFQIDAGTIDTGFSEETYCPWLTPQVMTLAEAAYQERSWRKCEGKCSGYVRTGHYPDDISLRRPHWLKCPDCKGTGRIDSGTLDPVRLAVLADSLEESGCADEVLLGCLRSVGPHYRGCWVVDTLTGRK